MNKMHLAFYLRYYKIISSNSDYHFLTVGFLKNRPLYHVTFFGGNFLSSDSEKDISSSESELYSELESKCLADVDANGRATSVLFSAKLAGVTACNKPELSGPQ